MKNTWQDYLYDKFIVSGVFKNKIFKLDVLLSKFDIKS